MARFNFKFFIVIIFMQSAAMSQTPPPEVYIQDKNSGLVLEYNPNGMYEVTIEERSEARAQKWRLTDTGVAGYIFIQSALNNYCVTAGSFIEDPLYLAPKRGALDLNQVWILREPDSGTNPNFVIMSAKTGYVMDVYGKSDTPGTQIIIYSRSNRDWQQYSFYA